MKHGIFPLIAAPLLLATACAPYSPPAPEPTAIVPNHMVSLRPDRARPVPVTIQGNNLAAGMNVDLQTGEVKFSGELEARLSDVSLSDVEPIIEDGALVIRANVPGDLEPGSYHLFITGPDGRDGTLPDAFEVRDIASVGLSANDDTPVAGARVTITATILDSRGDPVSAELFSDVVFSLETGSGRFGNATLSSGSVRVPYDTAYTPEGALVRATEQISGTDVSGALLVDSRAGDVAGVTIMPANPRQTAGDPVELTAALIDSNHNLIPAALVSDITFEIAAGSGTLGQPSVDSEQIKIAYTTHTSMETAVVHVTEQVSGNRHSADSRIDGIAGDPSQLYLTASPPNPMVGTATNITAELQDENGNPIPLEDADDVRFTRVEGHGILSASLLIAGRILVPYATYRKVEASVIQGEVVGIPGIPPAQVSILTVGGNPVDVELVPELPTVGAGTQVQLDAYLLDVEGNRTSATAVADAEIAINAGPGTLDAPGLHQDPNGVTAVRATYNAPNALGQTVDFQATETVTGSGNTAAAGVLIVAGPVDYFDVSAGAPAHAAGSPFNISLTARDRFDNPADSFESFTYVADTTGTILPAISGDFLLGRRTETVIVAQTADNVIIHVEDTGGHFGDSSPFNVVGGDVHHFGIDLVADQVAGTPFDITIRALDELSNPMDTYASAVNIQDTTATIDPVMSGVFSGGVRVEPTTIFTRHPAVTLTVDDGLGHTGTSNTFAVSAGPPAAIVFTSPPQNAIKNTPSEVLRVKIQDDFGNEAPVATDTTLNLRTSASGCFDPTSTGAFDCSVTSITITAGSALGEFYYQDTVSGDVTLTVSDPLAALAPGSQIIKISDSGYPSRIEFVDAPASVDADAVSGVFTVQIQDVEGKPVTGHPSVDVDLVSAHAAGRFDINAGGPFDGSITQVRVNDGTSDAAFYYKDTRAGPVDIDATEANLVGDTASLVVLAGPVDRFEFDPIAVQQAGRPFLVRMVAYDAHGNPADSFSGTVTLADLTGTASPVSSGPFSLGERIETMTVTQAVGADGLTADDGSGHTGTSNDFTVLPGGVDHFSVDSIPSPQDAGTPFQIHIQARDAFLNIATQFIGVVDLADTTGFISPTQSGPFNQGERDENVTVTRAATGVSISVKDGAAGHIGWSNTFDVLHGPLDHFRVGPVPNPVGADRPFDVPMQARDAYDNVVASFTGTVNLSDLSGTLQPTVSSAFSNGLRTESVTVGSEMNNDRIDADDGSGHAGVSNLFDVIAPQPVELTAAIEFVPFAAVEGEGFAMLLRVDNHGDYQAETVTPIDVTFGGTGSAGLLSGPVPAQADIPGRSRATFTWTFQTGLGNAGRFSGSARAQGVDSDSGLEVFSNTAASSIPITAASCLLNPLYVSAGPNHRIACGESAVLGADPAAWGGVPAHIFDWTPDFALSATSVPNPTADPDMKTKYRVVAFDQLGCLARDATRVILEDGPRAVATADRQSTCDEDYVQFDAGGSTGTDPLSYQWDVPGVGSGSGVTASIEFDVARGWYPATLTVTDANGCRAQTSIPIGHGGGPEPAGPVTFTLTSDSAPADGSSEVTADSNHIYKCDGVWWAEAGKKFHALATRGTIVSADEHGDDGIQVKIASFGKIHVTIRADTVGGPGRLLVMTTRAEQESRGTAKYAFTGSTSLPRVADFGPSGHSDIAPPRFAVRFDKPMSPAATTGAIHLVGDLSGDVLGTAVYDARNQIVFFAPDIPIDPANEVYTLTLDPSATDTFGNHLDGNYNGVDDGSADAFVFKFGALPDDTPPNVDCRGESKDTFSPDDDTKDDITEIRADLADDTELRLWRIEIFSPEGLPVRTLVTQQTQNQDDVKLVWDGHDERGLLLDNARYDYRITAVDAAGNVSVPCTDSVEIDSVLDPAMFP